MAIIQLRDCDTMVSLSKHVLTPYTLLTKVGFQKGRHVHLLPLTAALLA